MLPPDKSGYASTGGAGPGHYRGWEGAQPARPGGDGACAGPAKLAVGAGTGLPRRNPVPAADVDAFRAWIAGTGRPYSLGSYRAWITLGRPA